MKFWTALPVAFTTVLFTTPAWAQATDQNITEGAGVIAWIVVGLIGGYLASRIVNQTGEGLLRDIILRILGGIVGGIIFRALGGHGVTGFKGSPHNNFYLLSNLLHDHQRFKSKDYFAETPNLWSILVAFVGGVVVLLIYRGYVASGKPTDNRLIYLGKPAEGIEAGERAMRVDPQGIINEKLA